MTIVWRRVSNYAIESACGRFRITLAYSKGEARYTLWHRLPHGRGWSDRHPPHPTPGLAKMAADAEFAGERQAIENVRGMLGADE